jgi:hypothetical protein
VLLIILNPRNGKTHEAFHRFATMADHQELMRKYEAKGLRVVEFRTNDVSI